MAAGIDLVPVSQVLIYPEPQAEPAEELAESQLRNRRRNWLRSQLRNRQELAEEPSEAAADELATMETRLNSNRMLLQAQADQCRRNLIRQGTIDT